MVFLWTNEVKREWTIFKVNEWEWMIFTVYEWELTVLQYAYF